MYIRLCAELRVGGQGFETSRGGNSFTVILIEQQIVTLSLNGRVTIQRVLNKVGMMM
jgi:hypothetical protein